MTFAIELDPTDGEAAYKQLAKALREAIAAGRLKPGDKMPSIRHLAASAAVSAATINRCYEELCSQKYLVTVPGAGTFVNQRLPIAPSPVEDGAATRDLRNVELSAYGQLVYDEEFLEHSPRLHYGAPLIADLPLSRWKQMLTRGKKFEDKGLLAYEGDPFGYLPLREALAKYLARSRSVRCAPEQIIVFPQVEGGTDLLCRLVLRPTDGVVLEDPCYPARLRSFRLHGAKLIHLPVDDEGMQVERLKELLEPVKIVHITPSHHDPSGVQLSVRRRQNLLQWARGEGALIVENDYDCEYQYDEEYLPAIQSFDDDGLVFYRYTFWRVLYPLVRMSLLVVPRRFVSLFRRAKQFLGGESPLLEQKVLADFIEDGHMERHIQRTRAIYHLRRVALIHALTRCFGRLQFSTAGMHLLVRLPERFCHEEILRCAREHGVDLVETVNYYTRQVAPRNEYMMGFAYYPDAEAIGPLIQRFADDLHESCR